jgi:CO/xanthine dehydrogenase Mo-binding subunit
MKDGHDLIGWGMATAMMQTFRFPSKARVSLESSGNLLIEAGAQEIGTGLYTILPQIAANDPDCGIVSTIGVDWISQSDVAFEMGYQIDPEPWASCETGASTWYGSPNSDAASSTS